MKEITAVGSMICFATIIMWVYLARIYDELRKIRRTMELNQLQKKRGNE